MQNILPKLTYNKLLLNNYIKKLKKNHSFLNHASHLQILNNIIRFL